MGYEKIRTRFKRPVSIYGTIGDMSGGFPAPVTTPLGATQKIKKIIRRPVMVMGVIGGQPTVGSLAAGFPAPTVPRTGG